MKGESGCPVYPFFSLVGLEINPETLPPPIILCIVIILLQILKHFGVCVHGVCMCMCVHRETSG